MVVFAKDKATYVRRSTEFMPTACTGPELAWAMGLSVERVRQIEIGAMKKLQRGLRIAGLSFKDFEAAVESGEIRKLVTLALGEEREVEVSRVFIVWMNDGIIGVFSNLDKANLCVLEAATERGFEIDRITTQEEFKTVWFLKGKIWAEEKQVL